MEVITSVEAVRRFFSTPAKPVTFKELKELGGTAIRDLAEECAPALGVQLIVHPQEPGSSAKGE